MIIKLEDCIDDSLKKHWFQKNKSTAEAIHIVRRLISINERAGEDFHMILSDWKKAFDNVSHEGLFDAMEKLCFRQNHKYRKRMFSLIPNLRSKSKIKNPNGTNGAAG